MRIFKIIIYIVFCLLHIGIFLSCLYLERNKDDFGVLAQVHGVIGFMKYGATLMILLLLLIIFLHLRDNWKSNRLISRLTTSLNEIRAKLFDYENPGIK